MTKPAPHRRNNIPDTSRALVRQREVQRCGRCGVMQGAGRGQWHHRRSRRVALLHRHCPCNGIYLCQTCHMWVHAHPLQARNLGLILQAEERFPYEVPVFTHEGWRYQDCAGGIEWVSFEPTGNHTAHTLRKGIDP